MLTPIPISILPGIEFNFLIVTALIVMALGLIWQLVFYWGLFSRLAWHKSAHPAAQPDRLPPVSVVICARNEYTNLEKNLPDVLGQDYDDFEVVVVNDCSDDDTTELLTEISRFNPALKVVHLRQSLNFFNSKKFPLSMGIKSAKNELLILTDADCKPAGPNWISNIVQAYRAKETAVVLAYGPYRKMPGLLNALIRFDAIHVAINYLSMALAGMPYMGVGRNLSYHKSLFIKNKGFTSHYKIASGDDDLFIMQVADKRNTAVVLGQEVKTFSEPKRSFYAWFRQKRRHLSTAQYYRFGTKFILGSFSVSQLLFFGGFTWLLFLPLPWWIPVSLFGLRLLSQLIVTRACMKQLQEDDLWMATPFFELFFIIFNPTLALVNLMTKQNKWK